MDQLIEKILKAPWAVKIAAVLGAALLVTALNYFMAIDPALSAIDSVDGKIRKLEGDFIDKQQIANNLNQYRREKELLEQRLKEALSELPNDKAIDELLRQLNDVGAKSGLEITSVEPGAEAPDQFFARIPIRMRVTGNFHEIAIFFDSVGKMKRIVNVNEIKLGSPTKRSEKMVVSAEFLATAFRFIPPKANAGGPNAGKGK